MAHRNGDWTRSVIQAKNDVRALFGKAGNDGVDSEDSAHREPPIWAGQRHSQGRGGLVAEVIGA